MLRDHQADLSAPAGQSLTEPEILELLGRLIVLVAGHGFVEKRALTFFHQAEQAGVHVLPAHFYSPVPDVANLPKAWLRPWKEGGGWNLRTEAQLHLLAGLGKWAPELEAFPDERAAGEPGFYWNNSTLCAGDASVYYALLRELRPRRIVEVGSGMSTMVALAAAERNGPTPMVCIEPFPSAALERALAEGGGELLRAPVQEVDDRVFAQLEAGDILFIDSTHVCKAGSDVNHLILRVLPMLAPGVIVHFHDIFLPWDMPDEWIFEKRIFWNEQYLLLAFLMQNPEYEIVLANQYLGREHGPVFRTAFPRVDIPGGASFWIRRKTFAAAREVFTLP